MILNVLIVEDDFIIQIFLEEIIKKQGANVIGLADNGSNAIELTKKHNPDLIFMDITIQGDLDGIETSQIINTEYQTPIVFVTGNSDQSTLLEAEKINPVSIISKPIDEIKFVQEWNTILDRLNNR